MFVRGNGYREVLWLGPLFLRAASRYSSQRIPTPFLDHRMFLKANRGDIRMVLSATGLPGLFLMMQSPASPQRAIMLNAVSKNTRWRPHPLIRGRRIAHGNAMQQDFPNWQRPSDLRTGLNFPLIFLAFLHLKHSELCPKAWFKFGRKS